MYSHTQGMHQWGQGNTAHHSMDEAKKVCIKFMNFYVIGQLGDGSQVEGIVEDMDDDSVTMLVPEMVDEEEINGVRQFDAFGDYGGWYNGYGGGYGRRRYRRFRRRRYPFRAFVYPFLFPYPFYF